jgi:release factor glutamine methyltransferase
VRPSEVLRRAERYLAAHGVESPRSAAEVLLQDVLGTDRAGLYTRGDGLTSAEARRFGRALCRHCTGTPVQHLTGRQQFRRLDLEVRPGVFVSRPETEVVAEVGLTAIDDIRDPVVVDVGTGTGAIALAIKAERSGASVWATDISPAAVELAEANARRLGLDVTVLLGDLFDPLPHDLLGTVNLVISNPPYVGAEEFASLPAEVRADPELALLGGTDVHRRLVQESPRWLGPEGALAVEIGSTQGDEVAALFRDHFDDVCVLPDLTGRDRVVIGSVRRPS